MIKEISYFGKKVKVELRQPENHIQSFWAAGEFYEANPGYFRGFPKGIGFLKSMHRYGRFVLGHLYAQHRCNWNNRGGELHYIAQNYNPGGVYIDIGSNIGNHTLFFAGVLDADRVISFEPIDSYREHQYVNIGLNDLDSITVFPFAISNIRSIMTMTVSHPNSDNQTARVDQSGNWRVEAVNLDSILEGENLGSITLVKIDTDGYNLPVLEGAVQTLFRYYPDIIIENEATAEEQQDVDNFLRKLGYNKKPDVVLNHSLSYVWTAPKP